MVKNGFSPELAFAMDAKYRKAAVILNGMFEGGEWDWQSMAWKKRS